MKRRRFNGARMAAGLLAGAAAGTIAQAQSADALIDKLVEKGVLSMKEANELREEADKGFTTAYQVKSGMPDWVNALKLGGDFRGRFEGFYGDNPAFVDRNRFRYRLRFGVVATLQDDFEVGLRLTSSEKQGDFGGDPISGNSTLAENGAKKWVFIDQAYAKWSPIHRAGWIGSLTIGKMESPFVFSDMILDPDYTPEGAALQASYAINDQHTVKAAGGGLVLDELGGSSSDPYLFGGQLRWDSTWNKKVATSVGVAGLGIMNKDGLVNGNVPNVNRGNTRNGTGAPAYNFNPVVVDASLTYTLESFPLYPGAFPVRVGGDYMNNPAAPSTTDNYAYSVGILLGKSGKKGTWDAAYTWKYLGGDAWYEELVDSDFGAFYEQQAPNAGFAGVGAGYGAGTNAKGHIVRLAYSPYDSLTLSVKWFLTELIEPVPTGSKSGMNRLQGDVIWRF